MSIIHIPFYPSDWLAGTRGMSAEETGVYITLIARMYEMAGPIEHDDDRLTLLCGCKSKAAFKKCLSHLMKEGKITVVDGELYNDKVQKIIKEVTGKSSKAKDAANARWKKKPNKNNGGNDANASSEHMPDGCHPKPKKEKELSNDSSKKADAFPTNSDLAEFVREWNSFAKQNDLAQVQKLTDTRKRHLKARLKDCGNLQDTIHILHQTATSAFLMGQNKRGWKMDFDFFVTESRFTKIAEGAYDRAASQPQQSSTNYMAELAAQDFGFAPKQERTDHGQGPIIDGTLQVAKGRS